MSNTVIRGTLAAILEGVANIGEVHDYERMSTEWDKFLAHFKTWIDGEEVIRGWTVGYAGMAARTAEFAGVSFRDHRFVLRGYLGLNDANESEKAAAALAEAVCDALDSEEALHDGSIYYETSLASVPRFETRLFGGVLCHYIEIAVTVTEV